jgi:hypothetical protein
MRAFLMLVYCTVSNPVCEVHWAHGIYPTVEACVDAAPTWLDNMAQFDKRKPTGAFCELAVRAPKPYTIAKDQVQ